MSIQLLILLDSVGCVLDMLTLRTYPLDGNCHPILDEDASVFLGDTEDSWNSALSKNDRLVCNVAIEAFDELQAGGEA